MLYTPLIQSLLTVNLVYLVKIKMGYSDHVRFLGKI